MRFFFPVLFALLTMNSWPVSAMGQSPDQAIVTIHVPPNAILYCNKVLMEGQGSVRKFLTPALHAGMKYNYHFVVELSQDGKRVAKKKDATFVFVVGRPITIDLTDLAPPKEMEKAVIGAINGDISERDLLLLDEAIKYANSGILPDKARESIAEDYHRFKQKPHRLAYEKLLITLSEQFRENSANKVLDNSANLDNGTHKEMTPAG